MLGNLADDVRKGDKITQDGLAVWRVTSTNASIGSEDAIRIKGVSKGIKGKTNKVAKSRVNLSWSRADDNTGEDNISLGL